jgi:hypothetical protein
MGTPKIDLRHKLTRPDVTHLVSELVKCGGKKTAAYKNCVLMIEYVDYLEAKLVRKDNNFKKMKVTITNLKEMTE